MRTSDACINQPVAPFIEGALSSSESEQVVQVIDPSSGRHLLSIPAGCQRDVDCAVASARRAFEDGRWNEASPSLKKTVLHKFAELISKHSAELDILDAGEMGKPIWEVLFNARAAGGLMRFCAEAVDKVTGEVYTSDKSSLVLQRRVPRGVVAAIVPWNFPTFNAVLKVAPALAAGNSVVLKPSELASRSALRLASIAIEAGLPPGVFNVLPGLGETVGRALSLHPAVDMVAFTGSTQIGKAIVECAGRSNMKVVLAECGGKSPHVVFDDGVDLQAASESIARMLLTNQGQICSAGSRLLVQRSIERKVVDEIAARCEQIVMGNALDPNTTFGPVASEKQCAHVMQHIANAHKEGARLVMGGRRALLESGGYFVEPTVFQGVTPAARIAQEEIFGPVLAVIPFDDENEAVQIANGTRYGLAAYVWTADLSRGIRLAKAIRSSVLINAVPPNGEGPGFAASAEPFGESGTGTEGGLAGVQSYMRRHLVWFSHT